MRYIAIDAQDQIELTLSTADRRDWRVTIDWATLAQLSDRRIASLDDARGVINRHMAMLELAAFRVISRGVSGDMVRLSAADLRLPLAA